MNWYKEAELGPDEYIRGVKARFPSQSNKTVDGGSVWAIESIHDTIPVKFRLRVGYREWGIEDITPILSGQVMIPVEVRTSMPDDTEKEETKDIVVDIGALQEEIVEGNGVYSVGAMTIILDANYQVDYTQSTIEVVK